MNRIMFYYIGEIAPSAGGVERVVALMHDQLVKRDFKITIVYAISQHKNDSIGNQVQLPNTEINSEENIKFLRNLIIANQIDLVLNFAAIFNKSSLPLVLACNKEKVPIISVLHNTLELPLWENPLTKYFMPYRYFHLFLYFFLGIVQRLPFYKGANFIYKHSIATVVLSDCYISQFRKFVAFHANNIFPIYNPLPITPPNSIEWEKKENIALFVGRLTHQKSVDKLLKIWAELKTGDWLLYIIGDGPQKDQLIKLANKLGIMNSVRFEGYCDPFLYYKRSKIFCLTSIYEGYPMTLLECQAYGVVPIIYNSFSAAMDIVTTGSNGYVIPAFDKKTYVNVLQRMIVDDDLLKEKSKSSRSLISRYNVNDIISQWEQLILSSLNK